MCSVVHVGEDVFVYWGLLSDWQRATWRQTDIIKECNELKKQDAEGKFLRNIQSISSSLPQPPPLPQHHSCSMLAAVFLYKRPIQWDARMAMEVFDGHHTKAQRQRGRLWYPYQSPLLPLLLHNTASGTALLLLSAQKVEKLHPRGRNLHNETLGTHSICTLTRTAHTCSQRLHPCAYVFIYSEKHMCTRA